MSTDTLVRIAGSRIAASVSPLGAELQTLTDASAGDLLWNGDPAVWTGRAPLLFPIVGRVRDDTYRVNGDTFRLPQHGFARRRDFTVVERAPDRVTFLLEDDDETRAAYPFAFRLDMSYRVAGARLDMEARVTNTGDGDLPASFGYHPAFLWPLPYGGAREAHEIAFEVPETAPIRRPTADGLLGARTEPSPLAGNRLPLSDGLLADGALIFTGLASRRIVYGVPARTRLAMDFPDTPDLGIWSKPGASAGYVCVEPWHGYADPETFSGDFTDKPGTLRLAPGETRRFRMGVEIVD